MMGLFALPEGGLLYGFLVMPFNGRLLQMIQRLASEPDNLKQQLSSPLKQIAYKKDS